VCVCNNARRQTTGLAPGNYIDVPREIQGRRRTPPVVLSVRSSVTIVIDACMCMCKFGIRARVRVCVRARGGALFRIRGFNPFTSIYAFAQAKDSLTGQGVRQCVFREFFRFYVKRSPHRSRSTENSIYSREVHSPHNNF